MSKYDASIDAILDIEISNIVAVKKSLDRGVMEKVIDLMLSVKPTGHKVITAGCGTSGTLAERVAHSLCVVEVPATFCAPGNSIHGGMGVIQKSDVVVLFSKGGNTPEILNYIEKGVRVIYQEFNNFETISVAENIFAGDIPVHGPFKMIDTRTMLSRSRESLARCGIDLDPNTRLSRLSVAQRQLVEIQGV